MRKLLILAIFFLGVNISGYSQKKPGEGVLHDSIHTFIARYFPNNKVDHYKLDRDGLDITAFDIYLDNGSEIVFTRYGIWKEIDMPKRKAVPQAILPSYVTEYINKTYPKSYVTDIEKDDGNFEITLNNGKEFKIPIK